jgi:hypothetical protein
VVKAISVDFPQNDVRQVSSNGLRPPVFRDGGSTTLPKRGLLGNVRSRSAPLSVQGDDIKNFEGLLCQERVPVEHGAVPEMKEGPSEPACRNWLQTAVSCFGSKDRGGERYGQKA